MRKTIEKELIRLEIDKLIPYERNPRKIPQEAIDDVKESYIQCGVIDPIEIDENNVILSGHTRRLAALDLGVKEVDVLRVTGLTEQQKRKYRILANKTGEKSGWDYELLEWELEDLDFEGYDFGFDIEDNEEVYDDIKKGSLAEKYTAPPFSVLDARSGDWQKRKSLWLEKIDSGKGRDDDLLGEGLNGLISKQGGNTRITGTSVFDPALCETLLAWFCPEHGRVLDPFAGGSVRGLVSTYMGREYVGIDLSEKQIQANEEEYEKLKDEFKHPTWICGDSNAVLVNGEIIPYIQDGFDFLLTCPPYADLEVYSDDPRDLSNMDYHDFRLAYFEIIHKATSLLKDDAFAAIVVGEVRDKKGNYYNFVADTIEAFLRAGMQYYNECILVTPVGTAALRANNTFGKTRKVVKSHQNVLVFIKGDPRSIKLGEYTYEQE